MPWVPTNEIVQSQINSFKSYANTAFSTAINAIHDIANTYGTDWESVGKSPGGSGAISITDLPSYVKPTPVPATPAIEFDDPEQPGLPMSRSEIENALTESKARLNGLTVPQFTDIPLPIQLPSPPTSVLPIPPSDPAPITVPEYPDSPTYETPILPAFRTITLPTLSPPDLTTINALIASLRAAEPVSPVLPENSDFGSLSNYYYGLTNSQLTTFVGQCTALVSLCPRLSELLSGTSIGMPAAVAQALRDRTLATEDRLAAQAEQEVLTDWLSRGFTLPGGALEAKLSAIRIQNRDKKSQLLRDLWIEEAKLEIENLRFAIQQGIAYEGLLRDSWGKLYSIVQALAQTDIEVELKVLDAAINLYKTKVDAWQVSFATIKDQLQVELSKVEIFRSELDGQKLIGQLNQQDLDLYKTQWDAIGTMVAAYKTNVEAANGLLQAELSKLEYSAKLVQLYSARIGAYGEEWKAYGIAADAEKSKVELFDAQSKAFATRVQAYAGQVDAAKTIADLDVTTIKLQFDAWTAQLDKYKAELQTELARIDAIVKNSNIETEVYKTKAIVEDGYTDFEMKKLDYGLNVDRLNADITLKETELQQSREINLAKLGQDALDGIARTGAQLAGSAMSAMNVQASLGSSSSSSYNENHNYDET